MVSSVLELRTAAGVSQAELARRSGVAQPNIAAYESGRRRPSPRMLERLRAALRPRPSESVRTHRDEVFGILQRYRMGAPLVFGSVASGDDQPGSDLDLVVDVPDDADILDLVDAAADLEHLLGCRVDLVTACVTGWRTTTTPSTTNSSGASSPGTQGRCGVRSRAWSMRCLRDSSGPVATTPGADSVRSS